MPARTGPYPAELIVHVFDAGGGDGGGSAGAGGGGAVGVTAVSGVEDVGAGATVTVESAGLVSALSLTTQAIVEQNANKARIEVFI
ncbi:MAG: hypothetical protein ABI556_08335 [Gemmatimonadales bacterium]